jgi:chaperonin GroEL
MSSSNSPFQDYRGRFACGIQFSNAGWASILEGDDVLTNAVSVVLRVSHTFATRISDRPRRTGRNIIIEQSFGGPKITKGESHICCVSCLALNARDVADGVVVAKSVTLKDKFENLALSLVHSHACSLIQEVAGDGTMTATVLTCTIYSKGVKNIAVGCNPMDGCHHC